MMRNIGKVILSVLLVLALFPTQYHEAKAENGYPDLSNLKIDANGVATWDAYPEATGYSYNYTNVGGGVSTGTTFDFRQALLDYGHQSGPYTLTITAKKGTNTIAQSTASYVHTAPGQTPNPKNLRWDGGIARWDAVEGDDMYYYVYIYELTGSYDYLLHWYTTDDNYYDFTQYLDYSDEQYCFKVEARSGNLARSDRVPSPYRQGRFTKDHDLTAWIDQDILYFNEITDDEGYPAIYYVMLGSSGYNLRDAASMDLHAYFQDRNSPAGWYKIDAYAQSHDGYAVISDYLRYTIGYLDYYYDPDGTNSVIFTYDKNGGSGNMYPVRYEKTKNYPISECAFTAPEGYVFDHWHVPELDEDWYVSDVLPSTKLMQDLTFVAQWKKEPINAWVSGDFLYWDPYPGAEVYSWGIGTVGNMHGGWFTDAAMPVDLFVECALYGLTKGWYQTELTALDKNNKEISDKWVGSYYYDPDSSDRAVVIFDNNGEYDPDVDLIPAAVVEKGTKIGKIGTAMGSLEYVYLDGAEGKVFTTWYYDKECTSIAYWGDTVTQTMTLYAGWRLALDTIRLNVPSIKAGDNESDYPYYWVLPIEPNAKYAVNDAMWFDENGDQATTFESGKTYYLGLELEIINDDYAFAYNYKQDMPTFKCIVNGTDKNYVYFTGGYPAELVIYIPYTLGNSVIRLAGKNRYDTSLLAADLLKETLFREKFNTVILTTGESYADALAGSYLAAKNNAPILLISESKAKKVRKYIQENVYPGGQIYILGSETAVKDSWIEELSDDYAIGRLAGSSRYATNLEILKESGVGSGTILVTTGESYADSLSASATGLPVLLVTGNSLKNSQKRYLSELHSHKVLNFIIIGSESAVSKEMETALSAYGTTTKRIYGTNRYLTSNAIAEYFFPNAEKAVIAWGDNFPDGLSGGVLANKLHAPLLLSNASKANTTKKYTVPHDIHNGVVMGGTGNLPDALIRNILQLEDSDQIITMN